MLEFHKPFRAILIAMTVVGVSACEETSTTPEGPEVGEFTITTRSLPADGEATTLVSAAIPLDSRVEPRQITFASTAGTFSGQAQHVTVAVGPDGRATALLKAPTAPALAFVTARAGETTLQDSVRFVAPAPALQAFTVSSPTVPADNETTVTLRAVAAPSATAQPRLVTFHSSSGSFLGGNGDSIVVAANGSGEAVAVLKAPGTPGLAVVRARAGATELQNTIQFTPAPPQLQTLSLAARELPADGATTVTLRALLSPGATNRNVRFGTTAGTLLGTTGQADTVVVPADPAGVATVLLKADTALGVALIRASAGSTTILDSVRFVRARPDQISLSADSFRVLPDPAHPLNLTVTLGRSIGRVTRGATVEFTAMRPDSTSLGWFGGTTTSDNSGTVTTNYTPGSTTYEGSVIITARTTGINGETISDSITLEVRGSP